MLRAVASAQGRVRTRLHGGRPTFSGVLDGLSIAATRAYSLRRLSANFTGSLIRVRRSSDNVEQDIGFNLANVLDTTALLAFVGANNGFIVKWYDQVTGTASATQATAASQPRIVSAGVLETLNSLPTVNVIANTGLLDFPGPSGTVAWGISAVVKRNAAAANNYFLGSGPGNTSTIKIDTGDKYSTYDGTTTGTGVDSFASAASNLSVISATRVSGSVVPYLNGSAKTAFNGGTASMTMNAVGYAASVGFNAAGQISEVIWWGADLTSGSTLTTVMANQKSYWGTP